MNVTELLKNEDRAVSPVIGVILMVAITVILAAVIGTFVLGLGDQVQQTAPNANFAFDFDEGDDHLNNQDSTLVITHDGGDGIDANELYLKGDVSDSSQAWGEVDTSLETVRAGDSVTVSDGGTEYTWDNSGETVRVVWDDSDSDRSSTLRTWTYN